MREATSKLSRLLARVAKGHEVVVTRGNVSVARLVPHVPPVERRFGAIKGRAKEPKNFFDALPGEEE